MTIHISQVDAALRHTKGYFTHICYSWLNVAGSWCTQTIARLSTREHYGIPAYAWATPCRYDYERDVWIYVQRLPSEDQLLDARLAWLAATDNTK